MRLPVFDRISYCPSYDPSLTDLGDTKHDYLLHLDRLLGRLVKALHESGAWSETVLVLASDHGYHLGCSACRAVGDSTPN